MVLDAFVHTELEPPRDDFLSVVSHELRTSLTVLKLQTQQLNKLLARQDLYDCIAILAEMEAQIQKMERLNGDLLNVSNMQTGRLEYVQESVDLNKILHEIADIMQQMHPTHTIVVRGAATTCLFGDPDRLGQVFINLLSNAIKYSPRADTVEVTIHSSAEAITISVRDHGIGIPQDQRERIFERFYRVVDPSTKAFSGLGIGLYIVTEIIKHHGGTITVESAMGKGSTFQVVLPLTSNEGLGNASVLPISM
ncbi:MAG TPA: HAMP domain-containing sensor histidine kinase [Ktedonobacteraceae bacterium]